MLLTSAEIASDEYKENYIKGWVDRCYGERSVIAITWPDRRVRQGYKDGQRAHKDKDHSLIDRLWGIEKKRE